MKIENININSISNLIKYTIKLYFEYLKKSYYRF